MKKQLTGIAWILFGMLPGLSCGVFGLITAARNSGE